MYLVDTNVFLEVLLKQDKSEQCKTFLNNNISRLTLSDFSLHSIGVILFRKKNELTFQQFITDVIPKINIATLPTKHYSDLVQTRFGLDFDDAYQFYIAKTHHLKIVTMDNDFKKVQNEVGVIFL